MKNLLIILIILLSCSKIDSNQTLKFGVLAPFSGDYADSGNFIKKGIEKAKQEINDRNLEIYYEDACTGKDSILALNHLINIKKINTIASNYCVIALSSMNHLIKKNKLITVQTSVLSNDFLKDNNYIYTSFSSADKEMKLLANLIKKENKRRLAIIKLETPWGIEYLKLFKKYYTDEKHKIISIKSKGLSENDYKAEIVNIKQKNPDGIVIFHLGKSLSQILKQLSHIKVNKYGAQEAFDQKMLGAANLSNDNFKVILPWKHIGNQNPLTMHAYNNVKTLYKVYKDCENKKSCIQKTLTSKLIDQNNNIYTIAKAKNNNFELEYVE